MVRSSQIVITYLVIGVVMFGGGAIAWDDVGIADHFVDFDDGNPTADGQSGEELNDVGGAIEGAIDSFIGGVVIVWGLVTGLIGFMNWPIIVLNSNNAPPIATALLGGPLTAAFYMSIIRIIRTSV